MYEHVEKPKENKSRTVANSVARQKNKLEQGFDFEDNRIQSTAQGIMQKISNDYAFQPIQEKEKKEPVCTVSPLRQLKIVATKEGIVYPNSLVAYEGLTKSKNATLEGKFTASNDILIKFYLYYLDRKNEVFQNFINLEYDILHKLENGCGSVSSAKILHGLEINPDMESLYNLVTAKQFFGTDVGLTTSPDEARTIFTRALTNGYRNFDTAAIYLMSNGISSINALWAAADELNIERNEITVIYKVVHAKDDVLDVDQQLENAKETLGGSLPDILMLHETSELEDAQTDLSRLTRLVATAQAKAVGVSNVNIVILEILYAQSVRERAPIKYVENRYNPYYPDNQVRDFCIKNSIHYMGYGVIGSAQAGVCKNDGAGLPAQYLVALSDPRLQNLASQLLLPNEASIGVGELLYAWAAHKGVASIAYSTDPGRQAKNYAAQNIRLSAEQILMIDNIVLNQRNVEDEEWGDSAPEVALKSLFAAVTDPTVWFLMTEICDSGSGPLVNAIALRIVSEIDDVEEQRVKLNNFAWNIMRFAADLQAKANPGRANWFSDIKGLFRTMAEAAIKSPEIFDLSYEWAMKSSSIGGDAQNAIQRIQQIVSGEYIPDKPITETGRRNSEGKEINVFSKEDADYFTTADCDKQVQFDALVKDITCYCYQKSTGEVFKVTIVTKSEAEVTVTKI